MGSSCSSGQGHKDKDSGSTRSEESPSYQVSYRVSGGGLSSGVVLEVVSEARKQSTPGVLPQAQATAKPCPTSVSDTASPSSPAPVDKTEAVSYTRLALPAPSTRKAAKISLYICAADSQDCKVEKGVVHNEVYPGLRERCRQRGFELHVVDLHWSIQERTPEPSQLCLHELHRQRDRGYLIPVVLLNSTLGAPLLPKTIETADFEAAASSSPASSAILNKWYDRDTHAQPPCYRLLPAAHHIPRFKSDDTGEKEKAADEWRAEVEEILGVMLAAFSQELRDTYLTTVIEQEVHNTVLMSQELAKRCIWISRVYTHLNGDRGANCSTPGEAELKRRLDILQKGLKSELKESHILRLTVKWSAGGLDPQNPEHGQYLAELAEVARTHISNVVDSIMDEHTSKVNTKDGKGYPNWLVEEADAHDRWAELTAQCCVNRQSILEQINAYVGCTPVIISGGDGCGKTTLVSRLAQTWGHRSVVRCVNLTAMSSTLEGLLVSVVEHCRAFGDGSEGLPLSIPHNLASYSEVLPAFLKAASEDDQLLVIIDGVDQVREFGSCSIDWIPQELPANVKLVVTLSSTSHLLKELKLKHKNSLFIQMTELDKKEGESILLSSVMEYNHSVNSHIQDCILASVKQATLPLYIKVLAWQTSWCSEFEHRLEPKGNLHSQLSNMLSDLEAICGQHLVRQCLSLVTAAKWGLTDSEMVDLLSSNKDFHTSNTYLPWGAACLFWSVLCKQLAPFLRSTNLATLTWRDVSLRRAVAERYSSDMGDAHRTLYKYFSGALWEGKERIKARQASQPNRFANSYNRRKLEELPYQAFKSEGSLKEFSGNHEWVYDKLCGSTVFQVLEDLWLDKSDGAEALFLQRRLERSSSALDYDGRQFYSRLIAGDGVDNRWTRLGRNPPVPSLLLVSSGKQDPASPRFDLIVRLPSSSNFVVTVATGEEEISVWDVLKYVYSFYVVACVYDVCRRNALRCSTVDIRY